MARTPASQATTSPAPGTPGRRAQLVQYATLLGILVASMWALELIDYATSHALDAAFGIRPRSAAGLIGLVGSPFMHGDVAHLAANTVPFFVLGFLLLLRGVPVFVKTSAFVMVVGGLLVWIVGASNSNHIGASGVIFGYFGFLLAAGFFERSLRAILVAALVAFLYGGIIFGVVPGTPGVSWEGHLFGFLSGAGWAYLSVGRQRIAANRARA